MNDQNDDQNMILHLELSVRPIMDWLGEQLCYLSFQDDRFVYAMLNHGLHCFYACPSTYGPDWPGCLPVRL